MGWLKGYLLAHILLKRRKAMSNEKINENILENVSGGTFFPNTYSESTYNKFGITTNYHAFSADEFFFNGKKISIETADAICKMGEGMLATLNGGYKHMNEVSTTEPSFIRAFNSQLKGIKGISGYWDGTPGRSL